MAKQLADAHRRLAEQERGVERRMHALADQLPDPDEVHRRADEIGENARRHSAQADRLEVVRRRDE